MRIRGLPGGVAATAIVFPGLPVDTVYLAAGEFDVPIMPAPPP